MNITLHDLTDDEAYALAQLCKRATWEVFNKVSANRDECVAMDLATIKLRRALAEAGVDPR